MTTELRPIPYVLGLTKRFPGFTVQSLVLVLMMALVNLPLPLLQKITIDIAIPSGQSLPVIWLES